MSIFSMLSYEFTLGLENEINKACIDELSFIKYIRIRYDNQINSTRRLSL